MPAQASKEMISLMEARISQLPGPAGDPNNEAYMTGLVGGCDALAMFASDGSLMWAWSQDQMNGWYWHVDVEDAPNMYSQLSYDFKQSDGSSIHIPNETQFVADFMADKVSTLFFNGSKFHVTQKDVTDDGIIWAVMGGADGRGLHCSINPTRDCMVVAAASTKASPSETFLGIETARKSGPCSVDPRTLGGAFRQFAPGALGV